MKRPAFQFYPADWLKDPALSVCSLAAKGLWIQLMCIAHEAEEYGFLAINGKPMSETQIARLVGETPTFLRKILKEIDEAGVFSRDERGVIYSRRMVRDERVRNARAKGGEKGAAFGKLGAGHGIKGGRPRKQRGDNNPPSKTPLDDDPKPPPSSSSSSSSSEVPLNPQGDRAVGQPASGEFPDLVPVSPFQAERAMMPRKASGLSESKKKQLRVAGNTPLMARIGSWFGRRPDTLWTVAELGTLLRVAPSPPELGSIETYYLADNVGDRDCRRHDLQTLLNNWQGELDRARNFNRRQTGGNAATSASQAPRIYQSGGMTFTKR